MHTITAPPGCIGGPLSCDCPLKKCRSTTLHLHRPRACWGEACSAGRRTVSCPGYRRSACHLPLLELQLGRASGQEMSAGPRGEFRLYFKGKAGAVAMCEMSAPLSQGTRGGGGGAWGCLLSPWPTRLPWLRGAWGHRQEQLSTGG